VPSRLSADLPLPVGNDSSRTGRTFKSAYFLHVIPHVSHKILVGKFFGALYQTLDSRVRHAPHILLALIGSLMTEPSSSSESPTRCRPPSMMGWKAKGSFTEGPCLRIRAFSSPSLELRSQRQRLGCREAAVIGIQQTHFFQCP
jgi:hypothetical protein